MTGFRGRVNGASLTEIAVFRPDIRPTPAEIARQTPFNAFGEEITPLGFVPDTELHSDREETRRLGPRASLPAVFLG